MNAATQVGPNIIRVWENGKGVKFALASLPVSFTPLSRGCSVQHYITFTRIKPEYGEILELHNSMFEADSLDDASEAIWLEAMLDWGDDISKRGLSPSVLDDDDKSLIEFSIEQSLRSDD